MALLALAQPPAPQNGVELLPPTNPTLGWKLVSVFRAFLDQKRPPKISEHEALCWQHSGPFDFLPLWREPQLYAGLTSGQVVYFSDPWHLRPPDRITNILQPGFETIRDCCKEVKWTSLGLNPGSALQFPHPKQGNSDPHPQITNAHNNAWPVMSTFWRFTGFSGGL